MNRRDSLKILGISTASAALLLDADATDAQTRKKKANEPVIDEQGRQPFEIERDKQLHAEKFFTAHEMATITVLADIIIPKDGKSGSASDAKVPDFIEFIVKDIPSNKTPMRGGLQWLDLQCLDRYNKRFVECSHTQQIEMVTDIAYPQKAKPGMKAGVTFFNRMRDLTASGFFTSKIGLADIGYMGNQPNQWKGVPEDVLKHYGMENE